MDDFKFKGEDGSEDKEVEEERKGECIQEQEMLRMQ
jgi:hypothetical protein